MSTIAVFGVLGGGAYAAAQIGADDIKRNAVRLSGPVVLEGRALARFTIAIGSQVTVVEARIVFVGGECWFNAVATEIAT